MYSASDLKVVQIVSGLTWLLALLLWLSNRDVLRKYKEGGELKRILLFSSFAQLMALLSYTLDGTEGNLTRWILTIAETLLFLQDMLVTYCWYSFYETHLDIRNKSWKMAIRLMALGGVIFLVISVFTQDIFYFDERNHYQVGRFRQLYFAFTIMVMSLVLLAYRLEKRKRIFPFFRAELYCLPIIVAQVIQMMRSDYEIIHATSVVCLAGVLSAMKNEQVYKDGLTGIYNRTYLNHLANKFRNGQDHVCAMIDLNAFKQINDQHGHHAGDEALMQIAVILEQIAGHDGSAIRISGDEFMLILSANDERTAAEVRSEFDRALEEFNRCHERPYTLSASMGVKKVRFDHGVDEVNIALDRLMYEEKERYYQHQGNNRRRRR